MVKICFFIVSIWHTRVWFPLMVKLVSYKWGEYIVHAIKLTFGSLIILHIISPEEGEIPCLIHLFIRRHHKIYSNLAFKLRIRYLLKLWRIKIT